MLKEKHSTSKNPDNPLAVAFNFDAADLQDNQQGFISYRQKNRLKWNLFWNTVGMMFPIGLATLWTLVFFSLTTWAWSPTNPDWVGELIASGGGLLVGLGFMMFGFSVLFKRWRNSLDDLRQGTVEHIVGIVTKNVIYRGQAASECWIVIQNRRFDLNLSQHNAIHADNPYSIYIVPKTQHILSIERSS